MNKSPIHIPKPCHENWLDMTPEEKGRHCALCNKVVVDFTETPTEKIVEFVSSNTSGKVCGRFRKEQVNIPDATLNNYTYLGRMRVFLAALLFVFGGALFSSCRHHREVSHNQGDVRIYDFAPSKSDSPVKQDNNHPKGHVRIAAQDPPPVKDTTNELTGRVSIPK